MIPSSVAKRDGRVVSFNQDRINRAIYRCFISSQFEEDVAKIKADKLTTQVVNVLSTRPDVQSVEQIQDVVESVLNANGEFLAARQYILYRRDKAEKRKHRPIPEKVKTAFAQSDAFFPTVLQKFQFYDKYSRFDYTLKRRETWIETVNRSVNFLKELSDNKLDNGIYDRITDYILNMKSAPSMRLLAMAGPAARRTNIAIYNCSYQVVDSIDAFVEALIISMNGTGVGYSVERKYVEKLDRIKRQTGVAPIHHIVDDTSEGWSEALRLGLSIWFNGGDVSYDYSQLRPAGAPLKTKGGRSSGPDLLRKLLFFVRNKVLSRQGGFLRPIDAHDIMCVVGTASISGGVRRTALIALFDPDDLEMLHSKSGNFEKENSQRWNANNSAVWPDRELSQAETMQYVLDMHNSGRGEPGIFSRRAALLTKPERRRLAEFGTNPCVTGDTLVAVADGRGNVSIRQLAEEGKDVPVYCLDKDSKLTIQKMVNPRLTGKKVPVYEVEIEGGHKIRVTGNHRFLINNVGYVEAKNLHPNDSLLVCSKYKSRNNKKDYWKLCIKSDEYLEHKEIAKYNYGDTPDQHLVHHINKNSLDNNPSNLVSISILEHNKIHGFTDVAGVLNPNYSGVTNEDLKNHMLALAKQKGRQITTKDWEEYAVINNAPKVFSTYRKNCIGTVESLAAWASFLCGYTVHKDIDRRTLVRYENLLLEGYNCDIDSNNKIIFHKICEFGGEAFDTYHKEVMTCVYHSHAAAYEKTAEQRQLSQKETFAKRKKQLRKLQATIYLTVKGNSTSIPKKLEWVRACKERGVSPEISRESSPFRNYNDLQIFANNYNHKVVSVKPIGCEDVYNGTVEKYHNFFVGGWEENVQKNNGKTKLIFINNANCGEVVLRPFQFCNLSSAIARSDDTFESLKDKVEIATIIGTIQSMATNFPGLRPIWKENCDEERLLGVDITGQMDCRAVQNEETMMALSSVAYDTNEKYAKILDINQSAAITCVKPSGNSSQMFDCASGLHSRWSKFYVRNVRIDVHSPVYRVMRDACVPMDPENGQSPSTASMWVAHFPVKAPNGAITRYDRTAIEQCNYWLLNKENWTEHNPSATITYKPDELIDLAKWIHQNQSKIGGLTFLPASDSLYEQMPYEEISEEDYIRLAAKFPDIDFSKIYYYEDKDLTTAAQELACSAGICEL